MQKVTVKKRVFYFSRHVTWKDPGIICYIWLLLVETPKISPPGGRGWACTFSGGGEGGGGPVRGFAKMSPHKYGTDRDTRDSPPPSPLLQLG